MTSLLFFLVSDFHQGLELLVELPLSAMARRPGDPGYPAWGRAWARTSLLFSVVSDCSLPPFQASPTQACLLGGEGAPCRGFQGHCGAAPRGLSRALRGVSGA